MVASWTFFRSSAHECARHTQSMRPRHRRKDGFASSSSWYSPRSATSTQYALGWAHPSARSTSTVGWLRATSCIRRMLSHWVTRSISRPFATFGTQSFFQSFELRCRPVSSTMKRLSNSSGSKRRQSRGAPDRHHFGRPARVLLFPLVVQGGAAAVAIADPDQVEAGLRHSGGAVVRILGDFEVQPAGLGLPFVPQLVAVRVPGRDGARQALRHAVLLLREAGGLQVDRVVHYFSSSGSTNTAPVGTCRYPVSGLHRRKACP